MGRLDGLVTLITGTAGGQGRAAAERFAAEGALVCGCDVNVEGAEETLRRVTEAGGRMTSWAPVDLADKQDAARFVDGAVAAYGGIDVLYNNASATRVGPFSDVTEADWHFVIRNELDLVYVVTSLAWPHLIARGGGVVINTASVAAGRGATFIPQAAHGAAKGGVLALTRHLAASGAEHGIRVNAISPGLIATPQIEEFISDPDHPVQRMAASHPLGRIGRPEDVAGVALFLASPDGGYVNAAEIVVDGGQSVIV